MIIDFNKHRYKTKNVYTKKKTLNIEDAQRLTEAERDELHRIIKTLRSKSKAVEIPIWIKNTPLEVGPSKGAISFFTIT